MIKNKIYFSIYYVVLCIVSYPLHAVIIGSNTTPSRQPSFTFPSGDNTNQMQGFAVMDGGFVLTNATTTCLFNAYFPIGGTVTLNGGTLNLGLDLMFASTANITNAGLINGNNLLVQLPYKNGVLTLNGMIFNNARVMCGSDMSLNGLLRFNGTCVFDCQGKTINCANGGIVVGTGGSLLIKNATLNNVATGGLYCADSAGTFSFSNSTIIQDGVYSFSQGRVIILDSLTMTGSHLFVYQSSAASSIQSNAQWYFTEGMTFSYVPPISARNLIGMQNRTSVLWLQQTTLYSTPTGLQLTVGTLRLDGTCPVLSDAHVAAEAITFGDGVNGNNDLFIDLLAESGFNLLSGLIVYNDLS
jgi:hypothetical protein